jgi:hypothetical protein
MVFTLAQLAILARAKLAEVDVAESTLGRRAAGNDRFFWRLLGGHGRDGIRAVTAERVSQWFCENPPVIWPADVPMPQGQRMRNRGQPELEEVTARLRALDEGAERLLGFANELAKLRSQVGRLELSRLDAMQNAITEIVLAMQGLRPATMRRISNSVRAEL